MVKKRELQAFVSHETKTPTAKQIELFASQADGGEDTGGNVVIPLDATANRDFKSIRVPFNAYEFSKLEELSKKTGRSKLNAIRWAILKLCEEQG